MSTPYTRNKLPFAYLNHVHAIYEDLHIPENAISSRAPWSPIFQTSKNSNFKVPKKYIKKS
jgi:hypothetical protein